MKPILSFICFLLLSSSMMGCNSLRNSPDIPTRALTINRISPVILWLDAASCSPVLSNPKNANDFFRNAAHVGVTHVALETRDHQGNDILDDQKDLMASAKKHNLGIVALVPLFVTPADTDPEKLAHVAHWTGETYEIQPLHQDSTFPKMLSPADKSVREQETQYILKVASLPEVECIILLNCGFGDLLSDLGPLARENFQNWSGFTCKNWPQDVIGNAPPSTPYAQGGRGPFWSNWILWRSIILRDFLLKLRGDLENSPIPPPPYLSVLVDAPYAVYQRQGLNWCKSGSPVETDMPWLPEGTDTSGCTHLIDSLALGFWEQDISSPEYAQLAGYAWWASLSGAITSARRYTENDVALWGTFEVKPDSLSWGSSAMEVRRLTNALLIFPASAFISQPKNWELLQLVLD